MWLTILLDGEDPKIAVLKNVQLVSRCGRFLSAPEFILPLVFILLMAFAPEAQQHLCAGTLTVVWCAAVN